MYSFELRPNSSLTPREAAWFYFSIVAVSMTVAIGFTSLGYWPILPFAGLELAVLGLAMTVCRRRGETRELIRVDENSIVVSKYFRRLGGHREAVEYEFKRPWTKVELRPGRPAHWPSRLVLSCGGRSVEVGAFLTDDERRGLRARLAEVLAGRP